MTRWAMGAMVLLTALGAAGCMEFFTGEKGLTAAKQADVAATLAPSMARVEMTVRYDKGEPPEAAGWGRRCPTCGRYHGVWARGLVSEERPLELPAFVLSPTEVVCPDVMIHPRFVKEIAVRFGEQLVAAKPSHYARRQSAVFLELQTPLTDAKPLTFDPNAAGPYLAVTRQLADAEWTTTVAPLGASATVTETDRRFHPAPSACLIVTDEGTPVGLTFSEELPVDGSWKGSPRQWRKLRATGLEILLGDAEAWADAGLLRVALSFRSPKKSPGQRYIYRSDDEEEATERNVVGVLVNETTVLVLANLKSSVTARLERIVVHRFGHAPVTATFAGTLKDYGAFLATLDEPLDNPVRLSTASPLTLRDALLLVADVRLRGEQRVAYFSHGRVPSFELGWKRHVYPDAPGAISRSFVFTTEGELAALPIVRREKISEDRWGGDEPVLTASTYLAEVLANPQDHYDTSNVPLSEEEENRLAWLGVELQPLDQELARMNNVSDLTRDGQIGAIISYVYPDSPAASVGLKPGDILLRLHVEDEPQPLEVQAASYFDGRAFPWEHLDEVPEEYLNEIPTPWPPVENLLNRQLTEIGFGKHYAAELFVDGEVVTKDFTVVQSPPHYNSARKYKSESLGLTVRNLTYEVRRYFQRGPDEGGVIVSKVEPGSKAAVSGIKPYEIITHVNDQPVADVETFEGLLAGVPELRLKIKRMTKGRVVKIQRDVGEPPAAEPAPEPVPETAPAPAGAKVTGGSALEAVSPAEEGETVEQPTTAPAVAPPRQPPAPRPSIAADPSAPETD